MVQKNPTEVFNGPVSATETASIAPDLVQNLNPPFVIMNDDLEMQKRVVAMINQIVASSETGRDVLETASKAGYKLAMEFIFGGNGGCSKENKTIALNPVARNGNTDDLDNELIGVLIHEARHAGQFERGEYDACDENRARNETLKAGIMRTRAVEADAQATAAQALCEMLDAGNEAPLIAFGRASHNQTIARAVDRALYDPDALNNGALRTAAFMAWYDNTEVMEKYDEYYQLDMMSRRAENGTNTEDTYAKTMSPAKIVADLCLDSKGGNYFKENPAVLATGHYAAVTTKMASPISSAMKEVPNPKVHIENRVPFQEQAAMSPAMMAKMANFGR